MVLAFCHFGQIYQIGRKYDERVEAQLLCNKIDVTH